MDKYNIEYSKEAKQDLIEIKQYIKYNLQEPETSQKLIYKIRKEINNLKDKQAVYYELIGYLITKNTKIERKIKFSTENEYNINRFSKLLNNMNIEYKIEMQGNLYVITFSKTENIKNCNFNSDYISFNKLEEIEEKDIKALLRGAFLGAGFIN